MKGSKSIGELFNSITEGMSASEIKAAMVTSEISSIIADERIKLKMTQKEFSDFMGVSQAMISKWESGDYNFTISSISNIFDKLGMDFNFTIHEDEDLNRMFKPLENIKLNMPSNSKINKDDGKLLLLSA